MVGSLISNIGYQMQNVAVGWELYERTGMALALGFVGLAQVLPVFAFTLPAGHMADRFDRRKVLMAGQLGAALSSLGLAAVSWAHAPILLVYVLLFVAGTSHAFRGPARSALVPSLLPLEHFPNAATWNSASFQIASVVGPALGGAMIAATRSPAAVYMADALAALVFFIFVYEMRPRPVEQKTEAATLESLVAGFGFVWRTKVVLAAITLDMFAVLDILHVGPVGFGWLRAAPSVGAIAMSFLIAHKPPMRRAGASLLWSVAGFGASMIVFGLSRDFWLSLLVLGVGGALDTISVVIRHTLVQMGTPEYLRGRVSAVNGVFISSSNQLGEFESGSVAHFFGPVASVVSGGIGTIVVVLLIAVTWPQLRLLRSLQSVSAQE